MDKYESFRPLLTRIISYQESKRMNDSFIKVFPSPFNEDHFISKEEKIKIKKVTSFRPLLTRIISYLKTELRFTP